MAGLVPAPPIMWHGRASISGSPGQARRVVAPRSRASPWRLVEQRGKVIEHPGGDGRRSKLAGRLMPSLRNLLQTIRCLDQGHQLRCEVRLGSGIMMLEPEAGHARLDV